MFKDRLKVDELRAILSRAGLSVSEVLSTRSRPCKELGLKDGTMTDSELLELMADHPALIRRPLVIAESGAVVGFNWSALERLVEAISTEDGVNDA